MAALCERCSVQPAIRKERYCKACRKVVLQEMKEAGFLTRAPGPGSYRAGDARENTRETKFGKEHG